MSTVFRLNAICRVVLSGLIVVTATSLNEQARSQSSGDIQWLEFSELGILGNGWDTGLAAPYSRLPEKASEVLPSVLIELGTHAAGLHSVFVSDADTLFFKWKVSNENLDMPHMPATGVSGLDVYVRSGNNWRWVKTGFPYQQTNQFSLAREGANPDTFLVYLPLYNAVDSVAVGMRDGENITSVSGLLMQPPIVFYGTSITHGCCASRPGMAYTAILERRLMRETINLGFSGSCKMEIEMASLLAEIDAAMYFIDCLPNMGATLVAERAIKFLRRLRELRPDTPIVLVEDRTYLDAFYFGARANANATRRNALRDAYDHLVSEGFKGITYLMENEQLGDDGDATVDGSHPNDLGFYRQANFFEGTIRRSLK